MTVSTAPFAKMNGLGNKIIVADMRGRADRVTSTAAIRLASHADTHFDQLMELRDPTTPGTDGRIFIWNSDGSLAGACGNGMRCVIYAMAEELAKTHFLFETDAGLLRGVEEDSNNISVDMGRPRFGWEDIPLAEAFADTRGIELQIGPIDAPLLHTPSVASMGNPHAIFWAPADVWSYELEKFGPILENHPIFPDRANISIANIRAADHIVLRTWERGAGITQACGSAACAAAGSAHRMGRCDRRVRVTVPGGDLFIDWQADDQVVMTGPAEYEWSGAMDPETGSWERIIS